MRNSKKRYQQSDKGKAAKRKENAKYRQTPKSKAYQAEYQKAYRQTPNGKAAKRKGAAKRNTRNPNYIKATHAVSNAIATGKLPRADTLPCYYCPKPAQQYHHWHGYEPEHWLDVVPACVECHTKERRRPQDEKVA